MTDLADVLGHDPRSVALLRRLSGGLLGAIAADWLETEGRLARHVTGVGVVAGDGTRSIGLAADFERLAADAGVDSVAELLEAIGLPLGDDLVDAVRAEQLVPPEPTLAPGDAVRTGRAGCGIDDGAGNLRILTAGHLGLVQGDKVHGGFGTASVDVVLVPRASLGATPTRCGGFGGAADVASMDGPTWPGARPLARRAAAAWPAQVAAASAGSGAGHVIGIFDWVQSSGGADVWGCTWAVTRQKGAPLGASGNSGTVVLDGAGELIGHQVAGAAGHAYVQDIEFQLAELNRSGWTPVRP
ncbi:MAG: hypothetical protein AB7H43_00360 [Acidimicrobiia bacterium]